MATHLQNHNYNDILRTYCGKSNAGIYADREEWTNDVSQVDCVECIAAAESAICVKGEHENDADVLLGATIVCALKDTDNDFVSHVVLESVDGRTFTMTGWTYGDYECPLVIKEGIHPDEDGNVFRRGKRYE